MRTLESFHQAYCECRVLTNISQSLNGYGNELFQDTSRESIALKISTHANTHTHTHAHTHTHTHRERERERETEAVTHICYSQFLKIGVLKNVVNFTGKHLC